jgi:hypothetical protein
VPCTGVSCPGHKTISARTRSIVDPGAPAKVSSASSLEESFVSAFFVNLWHQRINEIKKNYRSWENTWIKILKRMLFLLYYQLPGLQTWCQLVFSTGKTCFWPREEKWRPLVWCIKSTAKKWNSESLPQNLKTVQFCHANRRATELDRFFLILGKTLLVSLCTLLTVVLSTYSSYPFATFFRFIVEWDFHDKAVLLLCWQAVHVLPYLFCYLFSWRMRHVRSTHSILPSFLVMSSIPSSSTPSLLPHYST